MQTLTNENAKRKRIFLVNRDFQLRYMRSAVLVGCISTLLTSVLILYPLYEFKILRIAAFLPVPVMVAMILAALANILFVAYMTVFFTHRVAGPMFALVRQLRIVEEGSYEAYLKVRDNDELQHVVRSFNGMVESLKRQAEIDLARVTKVIDGMEVRRSNGEEVEALDEARALAESLKRRLEARTIM